MICQGAVKLLEKQDCISPEEPVIGSDSMQSREWGCQTCSEVAPNVRLTAMRTGVSAVPSTRRSTLAWRMATMRGLHGRTAMNVLMASCRLKPQHQYMYANAVAGALPKPVCHAELR